MEEIFTFLKQYLEAHLDYQNIFLFMAIESSFIPFPSEIIAPPAGYLAAEGTLSYSLVILFSTLGSIVGAIINYTLAFVLGRPVVYAFANSKVGHICLLSQEKIEKAEAYFNEKGAVSTFIGRLIPGIRQLISIPAGLVKMNFGKFIFYTALGAGIWNCILTTIGYVLESTIKFEDIPAVAKQYGTDISLGIIAILVIIGIIYYFKHKNKKEEVTEQTENKQEN